MLMKLGKINHLLRCPPVPAPSNFCNIGPVMITLIITGPKITKKNQFFSNYGKMVCLRA